MDTYPKIPQCKSQIYKTLKFDKEKRRKQDGEEQSIGDLQRQVKPQHEGETKTAKSKTTTKKLKTCRLLSFYSFNNQR